MTLINEAASITHYIVKSINFVRLHSDLDIIQRVLLADSKVARADSAQYFVLTVDDDGANSVNGCPTA